MYIYIYIYIFYIYIYIYIYVVVLVSKSVKPLHKECSMKECYNTSKVFKKRKQLIWNLKFHADTSAIFSQMNQTLNLQYHGIFCIIWCRIKVFVKCFHGKSVCPVIWWAMGRGNQPDSWKQWFCVKRFVETFRRNQL